MENQIEALINRLRLILQRDGGDVVFGGYDAKTKTVSLRFHRADYACPGANGAMQMLFEKKLRAEFPEIAHVLAVEE